MRRFMDISEIFHENCVVYAHTGTGEKKETLREHITVCEKYFDKLCRDKEIEKVIERFSNNIEFEHKEEGSRILRDLAIQLVVFHDLGKCNPEFQRKIMKNKSYMKEKFPGVSGSDHSLLSAILYLDYFYGIIQSDNVLERREKRQLEILLLEHSFIIARHHSDFQAFGRYCNNLKNDDVKSILSLVKAGKTEVYKPAGSLDYENLERMIDSYRKVKKKNSREQNLREYFYYRFLYSLLVSCDYYATGEVCSGAEKRNFGTLQNMDDYIKAYNQSEIVRSIRKFQQQNPVIGRGLENIIEINQLRSCMFLEAERELLNSPEEPIYFLEAPTGSGKSNMAFNLSFHLMKGKNKLYYIYPFNTLVEQNRENLENLFSEDALSRGIAVVNSITPIRGMENVEKDSKEYYQMALLDRQFLNYPVILSTHVSFFQTLFGCQKEDIFGFLQLTDAVIVLDEIQSYKNSIWAEMIVMLRACADLMGMKIIIMSATLPNLEVLGGPECKVKYLIQDSGRYFQHHLFCDRVKISYELLDAFFTLEILLKHIEENYGRGKKVLIEFISKSTTEIFFDMLRLSDKIDAAVFCITGDHSIYEREKILRPIRENTVEECILVATQVVEAGVDIDMDIGYKDISKLDSEEQFLGRINRSFRREGIVYFFDLDRQEKIYGNDYRISKNLTLNNSEMREILLQKNFSKYYREVMELIKCHRNQSTEEIGLDSFYEEVGLLNYDKIEKRMKLIEEDEWSMDVFLNRRIDFEDGFVLDGEKVWNEYKELLSADIEYSEKQVKLSEVRSKMNYFIYTVKRNPNLSYSDVIGELRFIEDGEKYFTDGVLNRKMLDSNDIFFG